MGQTVIPLRLHLPLLLLACLAFASAALAHRLDEYLQATLVTIEPDHARLQIHLTPGVAVADSVLGRIDRDRDGVISTNETGVYAEALERDLSVRLDRRKLDLRLTATTFPSLSELRSGWGIIQVEYDVTFGALAPGAHRLAIENRHLKNLSVYLINAAKPGSEAIGITRQKRNRNQSVADIEFTFAPPTQSPGTN